MRGSSSSYYNSSSYTPYGTSSYTTSATSPWTPRTSSQLRSTMSSPSTSSYVSRTHLPFVPQSTLVAHCFTGVQSSTRPYGYSANTTNSSSSNYSSLSVPSMSRPTSIRGANSGYTSSLSRPQSTKRSSYISSGYTSPLPSSSSTSNTNYNSTNRSTSSATSSYKPSSYLSSTTYSTSASTSASRSTHRTRPLTPSSYTYRPIRLRERPILTHIWRQLNTRSTTSSNYYSSYTPTTISLATNTTSQAPELKISEPTTTPTITNHSQKEPQSDEAKKIDLEVARKERKSGDEEWSSDLTRAISRNKYLIKFREIDKAARSSADLDIISEIEPIAKSQDESLIATPISVQSEHNRVVAEEMSRSIIEDQLLLEQVGLNQNGAKIESVKPKLSDNGTSDTTKPKRKAKQSVEQDRKVIEETTVNIRIPIKLIGEAEAAIKQQEKSIKSFTKTKTSEKKSPVERLPSTNIKKLDSLRRSDEPKTQIKLDEPTKVEPECEPKTPDKNTGKVSLTRRRKVSAEKLLEPTKDANPNVTADLKPIPSDIKVEPKSGEKAEANKTNKNMKLKLKPVKTSKSSIEAKSIATESPPGDQRQESTGKFTDEAIVHSDSKILSSPRTPDSPKLAKSKSKVRKVAKRKQSNTPATVDDVAINATGQDEPVARMHPISPICDDDDKTRRPMFVAPSEDSKVATIENDKSEPERIKKRQEIVQQQQTPQRIRFREYSIDDFNFLSVLGHGGWGFVILAELKQHEACFAVKCIKKITIVEDDDYESILIERKVLALGNVNPFICKLFCTFETEGYLFFVMEFCAGGDLMFHVQRENKFTEPRCRFYAAEIICAIRFLHNRHIIYRDLKLDNILLDSSGHIRLVDFGMCQCRTYREEMLPSNFCGTPEYISPEIIKGVPYNHSVDWWSFGVLLYEMAVGKMPFRGNDENELLWNVCYEQIHYPLFLSRELTILLQQLLEREPTKRMGMASCKAGDIKDQAWFKGTDWPAVEAMKVKPPFVPCVQSKRDVQNFDADFTESQCQLSPVDDATLARIDQKQFDKFPYTNPEIQIFESI